MLASDRRNGLDIGDSPEWLLALIARGTGGFVEIRHGFHTFSKQHFLGAEDVAGDPSAVYAWTQRLTEDRDVVIGATVRGEKSGRAEAVVRTNVLWADLDDGREKLDAYPLAPNLVCETSPGRYQAWWALKEPLELADDDVVKRRLLRETFGNMLRRLQLTVGSDNVSDLPRVLRMPGSLRWKDCASLDDDPNMIVPIEFRPEGVLV